MSGDIGFALGQVFLSNFYSCKLCNELHIQWSTFVLSYKCVLMIIAFGHVVLPNPRTRMFS